MILKVVNILDFPYTLPPELFGGRKYIIPNDGKIHYIPYFDFVTNKILGIKIINPPNQWEISEYLRNKSLENIPVTSSYITYPPEVNNNIVEISLDDEIKPVQKPTAKILIEEKVEDKVVSLEPKDIISGLVKELQETSELKIVPRPVKKRGKPAKKKPVKNIVTLDNTLDNQE